MKDKGEHVLKNVVEKKVRKGVRERVDKMRNDDYQEDLTNPKARMGVYCKAIRIRHKVATLTMNVIGLPFRPWLKRVGRLRVMVTSKPSVSIARASLLG